MTEDAMPRIEPNVRPHCEHKMVEKSQREVAFVDAKANSHRIDPCLSVINHC